MGVGPDLNIAMLLKATQSVRDSRLRHLEGARDVQRRPAITNPHEMVQYSPVVDSHTIGEPRLKHCAAQLLNDADLVEKAEILHQSAFIDYAMRGGLPFGFVPIRRVLIRLVDI